MLGTASAASAIREARLHGLPSDTPVMEARGVGKMYRLYERPQDRLKHSFFARFGRRYGREFWALRDVTFQVRRGETIGVIGRNGSGKSTLLQILAGVLKPTTGEVLARGRVSALLELGSGFNPEFTGRENVFLNGAILGVPKKEMEARFEDIVAFADIGEFIDQPVKTYSSGMFVRLAFAVSTSIDADVLLIDEALAVGDVFFRQKCYQRLAALRDRGVAIVLVTHSMGEVEQFCQHALLLHHGDVIFQGAATETVRHYYLIEQAERLNRLRERQDPSLDGQELGATEGPKNIRPSREAFLDISKVVQIGVSWVRCTGVAICNAEGRACRVFEQGETGVFYYEFEVLEDIEVPIGGLLIQNDKGLHVHGKNTLDYGSEVPRAVRRGSRLGFTHQIGLEVALGEYTFEVALSVMGRNDYGNRSQYQHLELYEKISWLCDLPKVGHFTVGWRKQGTPGQLLHHGIANLPGECQLRVEPLHRANETVALS